MNSKEQLRQKRHSALRHKVVGTADRPRLSVYRGSQHIYVQLIDDANGKTLLGLSDKKTGMGSGIERAKALGQEVAKQAVTKKIKHVVFDRGGFRYHGQVKALADSLRENGLTI